MMVGAASVAIATAFLPADAAPTTLRALVSTDTAPVTAAVVTGPRTAPRSPHLRTVNPDLHLASTRPADALASPGAREEILTARRGDTLMGMLVDAGVDRREAHASIEAMRGIYNPRDLRPGDRITVTFMPLPTAEEEEFHGFSLAPDPARTVRTLRDPAGSFEAKEIKAALHDETRRFEGRIDSSLFVAATDAGVPPQVLTAMIKVLSYDVDFQRDIREGDGFSVMYSRQTAPGGETVGEPEILSVGLELSGQSYDYFRYQDRDGFVDYYNEKGQSVRKALLRTPINGARLSSGFGKRMHPVLGYTRMHKGSDFAAPTGTPIYAAGDGVVERSNRYGGYGNYVRLRHTKEWSTAYAHMSRFAKGLHAGKRVRQGDIIGYVGTTGRSTGPHLHYEVLKNGTQVNPMKVRFPSGHALEGKDKARFAETLRDMRALYAALPATTTTTVAEAEQ
jgi:murein DD-endopeptidase MepM/ murein hydrolase activator NlpD